MTPAEWVYAFAALASALATALAWFAKLQWSKEFREAKDEIIRAKDAHIARLESELQLLRELTPMKMREYLLTIKTTLSEYNDELKENLDRARAEIEEKDQELTRLLSSGEAHSREVELLREKKAELEEERASYTSQLLLAREVADRQPFIEGLLMRAASEPENLERLREFAKSEIIQMMDKPLPARVDHVRGLLNEVRKLKSEEHPRGPHDA